MLGTGMRVPPPGVNRVSYDALADPLTWAACAPGNVALLLASSTRVRSVWLTGDERADANQCGVLVLS